MVHPQEHRSPFKATYRASTACTVPLIPTSSSLPDYLLQKKKASGSLLLGMEFASAVLAGAASPSPAPTSDGKPKYPVEEDLLSLLGDSGGVDCTLKLALPGCAASRCPRTPAADVASLLRRPDSMAKPAGWCTMCGRTETPLWRHGPHGPKVTNLVAPHHQRVHPYHQHAYSLFPRKSSAVSVQRLWDPLQEGGEAVAADSRNPDLPLEDKAQQLKIQRRRPGQQHDVQS